jgi:drug/metabolite transporter (DMT)-like permease
MRFDRVVGPALAAVATLWGTAGLATQAALRGGVGPSALTALRMTVASLVLLAYLACRRRRVRVSRHLLRDGAVLALTQVVLPSLLFAAALQHLPSGAVSLLYATVPAATVAWMRVLLGTGALGRTGVAGLVVSGAGAALVVTAARPAGGDPAVVLGAWPVVVAVVIASFAGVYGKRHAAHPSLEVLAPEILIGTLLLLAPALVAGAVDWPALSLGTWAVVAYLAVGVTIVPAALLLWLTKRTSALRVSLVNYLFPLVAVMLGAWSGEPLTGPLVLGGAVLLAGVGLVDAAADRKLGQAELRVCPDMGGIPAAHLSPAGGAGDRRPVSAQAVPG